MTLNEKLVPAVGVVPLERTSLVAVAARTVTLSVPVIVAVTVSRPVIVCAPALMSVAESVRWPFVSVESAGSTTPAEVSLLVKCTVPA